MNSNVCRILPTLLYTSPNLHPHHRLHVLLYTAHCLRVPHLAIDKREQLWVAHGAEVGVAVDACLLRGADDLDGDAGGDLAN